MNKSIVTILTTALITFSSMASAAQVCGPKVVRDGQLSVLYCGVANKKAAIPVFSNGKFCNPVQAKNQMDWLDQCENNGRCGWVPQKPEVVYKERIVEKPIYKERIIEKKVYAKQGGLPQLYNIKSTQQLGVSEATIRRGQNMALVGSLLDTVIGGEYGRSIARENTRGLAGQATDNTVLTQNNEGGNVTDSGNSLNVNKNHLHNMNVLENNTDVAVAVANENNNHNQNANQQNQHNNQQNANNFADGAVVQANNPNQ